MAKTIYTEEQISAIKTRDKSLLVSAAAGAGKTATLTERIICSLIGIDTPYDKIDPCDPPKSVDAINRMLIVTFTNKAVDELRTRISKALKDAVAECHTGAYIDRISKDLPRALLPIVSMEEDGFKKGLLSLLSACPSESILKDMIADAILLRESYSGSALPDKLSEMIIKTGEDCRARRPECIIPTLEAQLYLLPSARISTIDSFCNDILKNNAERCGLPPRYRLADPIEAKVLEHSIWSERIDAAFEGLIPDVASPEEFEELATALTGVKTSAALEALFEKLYEKSKSTERGVKIFTDIRKKLDSFISAPLEEISYVEYAMERAREIADYYITVITDMMAEVNLCSVGIDHTVAEIRKKLEEEKEIKKSYKGKKKDEMLAALGAPDYVERFLVIMDKDRSHLKKIRDAKEYNEMKAAFSEGFVSLSEAGRGEKTPETVAYKDFRDGYVKAAVSDCYDTYFTYTSDDWREHITDLARLVGMMERFIQHFDEIYFKEKMKRAMFEYSDITRKCYEMLVDENGEPTEIALAIREQYSSVYIDEYQDVNALQDKIFLAVSKPDNRFTVGDIKQSIYGFRSARPDLFARMKDSYPKLEESHGSPTASIFMSKNFRCDETIINFVNEIFDEMFGMTAESIGYTPDDRLVFAKKYDEKKNEAPSRAVPEVMLFSRSAAFSDTETADDSSEEVETSMMSPLWVRNKIKELLEHGRLNNGKRITQKDIAIILRKDQGRVAAYREALAGVEYSIGTDNAGDKIRVKAPDSQSFFFNSEIRLALCLLNAINNPLKDIYLAGLMLSPLYGFTPSELAMARLTGGSSLWHSVRAYSAAHEDNLKFKHFIEELTKYRRISEGMRVDALILRLYNETGLLALGLGSGCKENLMLLYNYARQFEASSYEGLYSFINYVNTVIAGGETFPSKKEESDTDAVTIITVHGSKGLEYPIVFLGDASSPLISKNERDVQVAYSEEMGIGFKTRFKGGLSLVDSPVRKAIIAKNIEKSIEEELRVYYVALTRARERLFIVGTPATKDKESYVREAALRKKYKSPYMLRQVKTFVDILYSLDTSATITWQKEESEECDTGADISQNSSDANENAPSLPLADEYSKSCECTVDDAKCTVACSINCASAESELREESINDAKCTERYAELLTLFSERFGYKYPDSHLSILPEKMSISRLSPNVLDGADDSEVSEPEESNTSMKIDELENNETNTETLRRKRRLGRCPNFYSGREDSESTKKGIATHNVLQFMKPELLSENGTESEIKRLVNDGFITKRDRERVYVSEVELFERSRLFAEMLDAHRTGRKLLREFRFSVMLPAPLFATKQAAKEKYKGEEILLQGVIDCIYEDESGDLHLVDYKTDRLSEAELSDKAKAQKKLSDSHWLQLTYYAIAIRKMLGKFPKTVRVYSLPLGDTVDVRLGDEIEEFKIYCSELSIK